MFTVSTRNFLVGKLYVSSTLITEDDLSPFLGFVKRTKKGISEVGDLNLLSVTFIVKVCCMT